MTESFIRKDKWSPYLVGSLIGVLLTALFVIGQELGVSSGVARAGALIHESISPVAEGSYFKKALHENIVFNWRILFIIGLFLGAVIASKISSKTAEKKNIIWENTFGTSKVKRYLAAFIGGIFLMFGARLANGCTSGHAICGGAQLSISSWMFMISLFATAIPVSFALYTRKRG